MKKTFILLFVLQGISLFAQENKEYRLWEADSTWSKEIFHFPIPFAKEITHKGYEDARFPKGWGDKNSSEFWSYVFAWNIERDTPLTDKEMQIDLQYYFDGLMKVVNKDSTVTIPNTTVLIIEKENNSAVINYIGKVRVYDAFRTKAPILLHVAIDQYYCRQRKRAMIAFRFSPKNFDHVIWEKLRDLKLLEYSCN